MATPMVQRCAWVGVLVLSGCAGMPGMPTEPPAEKMQLMQSVLNRTPDGSVGYWRHNDDNFGLVAVDSTVRKGDSTCRLVREDQVVGGRSGQLVSSYCRVGRGAWQ